MGLYYVKWHTERGWTNSGVDGSNTENHHCIDVRTAWAKENYPEHCRIRNYKEPDPMYDAWNSFHAAMNKSYVGDLCSFKAGWKAAQAHDLFPD